MGFDLSEILSGVKIDTGREQIEYIDIDLIVSDPGNFYEVRGVEELAANISLCGLQQPLRVRQMAGDESQVVIISGHRRKAALELLIADGRDDLRDVPCIVESGDEDPDLTQLKLIYANADTRVLSSAEVAQQVEQVEKLLYSLSEKGFSFPGRMRDHVAQACKVSTGKIATLKKIRSSLIPQFMRLWEDGKLAETAAYELARLTPYRQKLIFDAQTDSGKKVFKCNASWIESIVRDMDKAEKDRSMTCSAGGKCNHIDVRLTKAAALGQYSGLYCKGCCRDCWCLYDCRFSCSCADDLKQAKKDKLKAERQQAAAEKAEKERPAKELLEESLSRVSQLREERGLSNEDVVKASLGHAYAHDVKRLEEIEAGKKVSLNDRMPGGIWAHEAQNLIATADLLGCSVDYLLCRTDEPDVPASPAPAGWRTGDPEAPTLAAAKFRVEGSPRTLLRLARWTGSRWESLHGWSMDAPCAGWIALPDDGLADDEEVLR